ncbi:MAG: hypothetical protein ACI8XV_000787 [Arenicella sp.]
MALIGLLVFVACFSNAEDYGVSGVSPLGAVVILTPLSVPFFARYWIGRKLRSELGDVLAQNKSITDRLKKMVFSSMGDEQRGNEPVDGRIQSRRSTTAKELDITKRPKEGVL